MTAIRPVLMSPPAPATGMAEAVTRDPVLTDAVPTDAFPKEGRPGVARTAGLRRRRVAILTGLLLCALILLLGSLFTGSLPWNAVDPWGQLTNPGLARDIVLGLRLPRALAAFFVGGLLGLAGALMQVLLRNPLADPYVLGTSGGASAGALLTLLAMGPGLAVSVGAGAGALAASAAVFALARGDHSWSQGRVLLTGVAIAALCGAITSLTLSLAPDRLLRGMVFWMLGDLSGAPWQSPALALVLALAAVLPLARTLNLLSLGPAHAASLGVHVPVARRVVYAVAGLSTAAAVMAAGMIGFVGLVVPHGLRLLYGNDHRLLLPASALGGGILLMLADLLSRTLVSPQQIPVGVVTAVVGAPFFLFLVNRGRRP